MEAVHSLRLERRRMIQMITCREWGEKKNSENVANKFALTATLKVVLFRVHNKVLYRERRPEVQPLPLLYTIFDRKEFSNFHCKMVPLFTCIHLFSKLHFSLRARIDQCKTWGSGFDSRSWPLIMASRRQGVSHQSLIRVGSAPRFNPLPFGYAVLTEIPFIARRYPFSHTYLTSLNKSLKRQVVLSFSCNV